jgi:hypothetical protein
MLYTFLCDSKVLIELESVTRERTMLAVDSQDLGLADHMPVSCAIFPSVE